MKRKTGDGREQSVGSGQGAGGSGRWLHPNVEMPDDEITVLVRCGSPTEDWDIRFAYHSDGGWRESYTDELIEHAIAGWLHTDAVAAILDGGVA